MTHLSPEGGSPLVSFMQKALRVAAEKPAADTHQGTACRGVSAWASVAGRGVVALQVVGHRGCAGLEPENTLRAFRRALALGVDAVECDVQLTRDERLAVLHDERLERTTNGRGLLSAHTWEDLRALDAGQGERIPSLVEVLALLGGQAELLCELKGPATAGPALQVVRNMGFLERVTFTSFELGRIVEVRRLEPLAHTGGILAHPTPEALAGVREAGAAAVGVHFGSLTPELVAEAHALGLWVRAWNPDSPEDQERVLAIQPDGISTNRPDRLLRRLGRTA